jgi:spore maturation protein CgeB
MKVYQCIHKYNPHIPLLEKKYGVTDDMDFKTLQRIVVDDGYASTYILLPALQHKTEEVFYTVWNYDRLQHLWAKEHGLKTKDLSKIKLAQIEEYKPDVFYNFSAFCDGNFIKKLGKAKNRKDIYWNGIIESKPRTYLEYDGQISLHKPYIKYWKDRGLAALELQPGIPRGWGDSAIVDKNIDVLFYGQYLKDFFGDRNKLIEDLLQYKKSNAKDVHCHLTYTEQGITIFRIPKLPWTRINLPFITFPSPLVREHSLPPLYGDSLYSAISQAKIVVNAYTNNNHDFKSNMRLFESIGLGAFLITEEGNYPDGFEPGVDFYTYTDSKSLISQIERVLADWPLHAEIAQRTQKKITDLYSKERQWDDFHAFASSL